MRAQGVDGVHAGNVPAGPAMERRDAPAVEASVDGG